MPGINWLLRLHNDARPRVHIWLAKDGTARWSVGATGTATPAPCPGSALNAALNAMAELGPAVIIWEHKR